MEIIIFIIILVGVLALLNSSLRKRNPNELSPEQKKFLKLNQDINDTVQVNYNKVKKFAEKKISLQFITSGIWRLEDSSNIIYTFRNNGEILIANNGIIKRGTFEYIIDNNSIIITEDSVSKMFYVVNLKNDILIIQNIGNNEILTFLNETKIKDAVVSQQNARQDEEEKLEYRRRTEEEFKYNEMIIDSQKFSIENTLGWKLQRHNNDFYQYINYLKKENKETSEIINDFKNWAKEDETKQLVDYIYYLEQ